jgi:hypothetical protein
VGELSPDEVMMCGTSLVSMTSPSVIPACALLIGAGDLSLELGHRHEYDLKPSFFGSSRL